MFTYFGPEILLTIKKNMSTTSSTQISLSRSCIGTRIRLYLNAPQLCTPHPDEPNRPPASVAYQRIITSFTRDHGGVSASNRSGGTKIKRAWTDKDRDRIRRRVEEVEGGGSAAGRKEMDVYWQDKLEREAATNWEEFYKTHRTNFFKDRHYMDEEFPELRAIRADNRPATLLEAGCGVGNSVFPLLAAVPTLNIYCCDFSPTAVRLVGTSASCDEKRCCPFVCDLSSTEGGQILQENILSKHTLDKHGKGVDLAMMMFCLSAIHPDKMATSIQNVANVMRDGGILWFRDYAENDGAQLKFNSESRISKNFYMRKDGTRSYFFTAEVLNTLMASCNLYPEDDDVRIIERVILNRKKNKNMHRAWIHGRYRKGKGEGEGEGKGEKEE